MRLSALLGPAAVAELSSIIALWPFLITLLPGSSAVTYQAISSPNLDLSQLGRVGLAGDFDAISLYSYENQNENSYSTNGSQSLLTRFPNGAFATLASADAYIEAMCSYLTKNGSLVGVVVGGNFTSLGGIEAQGIALFNPNTSAITPLPGLQGKVSALLCDQDTETVYVGGQFTGGNSTNAIAWTGSWTNMPFQGFNGPVNAIAKAPNGNVIFGGEFDGLGGNASTPSTQEQDQQIVNIPGANITTGGTIETAGFDNPYSITCTFGATDGANTTWLLADNRPGFWRADFGFGFEPTRLRLWNTAQDGRGTKTWRYTAFPINGIMNFTYTDPSTGQKAYCDATCPLPQNNNTYQDFDFVNVIGMSGFQIDISDWYGSGGGLDGIELFQNDIYAYAVNDFNEPTCANIAFGSNVTTTGSWSVAPSAASNSEYLVANFSSAELGTATSASVVFEPDIKQAGNYSVTIYTPGCQQDDSCSSRGIINVTGVMASGSQQSQPVQSTLYQTNLFDKYDQIYYGYVDANSDSFRPSVTLTPMSGSAGPDGNLTVVAQRVRFQLVDSSGGLNGLFEYNPNEAVVSTDFSNSTVDTAGTKLSTSAEIAALIVQNQTTYVAGNFSGNGYSNIFAINDNATSLPGGGLNGNVLAMFLNGTSLYVGGNFTNTTDDGIPGLNNIAIYSTSSGSWEALGAGVNGLVTNIVPFELNLTQTDTELVIALTGLFTEVSAFGQNESATASGLAIWVPSQKNWLQNLEFETISISGQLAAEVDVPGQNSIFAGAISSQGLSATDAVSLSTTGTLTLGQFPGQIQAQPVSSSSMKRRDLSNQNVSGVVTGYFYNNGGRNVTILGGHFTATASNGSDINNLMFINGSASDQVTGVAEGLNTDATVLALGVQGDVLYAGGSLSGTVDGGNVNGLILYDLLQATYVTPQPPALGGSSVVVNSIATRPNTGDVYIGGNFDSAGSLGCPSVCFYTTSASQWNRPGSGISGSVAALTWSDDSTLIVGGNLTIDNNATSMAQYNAKKQTWSTFTGGSTLPGPITALTAGNEDGSQFWVAGTSTNSSAFLMLWDGSSWQSVGDTLGENTVIRGLQILSLSKNHASNNLVSESQALLITGQLELPNFGNASATLFNGTTFEPFILSNTAGNQPGSLSQIFSEEQNFFTGSANHLALGFVVLIGLAISLGLIFIIVVIGIIAERIRRKREGYVPAPTAYLEKNENLERIPPATLFGGLSRGRNADTPAI